VENHLIVVKGFLIDPINIYIYVEKSPNDYGAFFHPNLVVNYMVSTRYIFTQPYQKKHIDEIFVEPQNFTLFITYGML
jgi:hypothetical protein